MLSLSYITDAFILITGWQGLPSSPAADKIMAFAQLPKGWDYGQGDPIAQEVMNKALAWEGFFSIRGWITNAGPGTDGEIAVSAILGESRIEVIVEADGTLTIAYDFKNRRVLYEPRLLVQEAQRRILEIVEQSWNAFVYLTPKNTTRTPRSGSIQHFGTHPKTGLYLLSMVNASNPTIHKYLVPIEDKISIELPIGAKILSFQSQHNRPTIWVLVDPNAPKETRNFRIFGTGHPIDPQFSFDEYIGTCLMNETELVWHLFEDR